jgi:hypothetical protein
LIKEKVRLIALLDEYFPELRNLFSDILGKSSLAILKNYPFPKYILDIGIEKVTEILRNVTKNRVGIKKGYLVYESAENSIGILVGLDRAKYRLNLIIRNLKKIQEEIDVVELLMNKYLFETGYSGFLLSIQGVGIVTAASFLTEIGDI